MMSKTLAEVNGDARDIREHSLVSSATVRAFGTEPYGENDAHAIDIESDTRMFPETVARRDDYHMADITALADQRVKVTLWQFTEQ